MLPPRWKLIVSVSPREEPGKCTMLSPFTGIGWHVVLEFGGSLTLTNIVTNNRILACKLWLFLRGVSSLSRCTRLSFDVLLDELVEVISLDSLPCAVAFVRATIRRGASRWLMSGGSCARHDRDVVRTIISVHLHLRLAVNVEVRAGFVLVVLLRLPYTLEPGRITSQK